MGLHPPTREVAGEGTDLEMCIDIGAWDSACLLGPLWLLVGRMGMKNDKEGSLCTDVVEFVVFSLGARVGVV